MEQKQTITGTGNIQVGGNYINNHVSLHNAVINLVNVNLSDVRTFEKVLLSIPPENFYKEVIQYYMNHRPESVSFEEIKKLSNS